MNILFLSRWFPFPPDNGSKLRIYHLLQGLSQHHQVTLLSFCDEPLPSLQHLEQDFCHDIQLVPWKPYNSRSVKGLLGFLSPLPRSLVETYSAQMEALVLDVLRTRKFDLVIASQLTMSSYYPLFRNLPALFEEIELGAFYEQTLQESNFLKRTQAQLRWKKLHAYLRRVFDVFRAGTVVSTVEFDIIKHNFPALQDRMEILPNCIDLRTYQDIPARRKNYHLVFTGSLTYWPNYQAMNWFVEHVFPLVRREIPNAYLVITGNHAGLPLPQMDNIILTGYLEDVRPLVASCDISIAPLWTGGGTRLKIIEAMALGTPVVATSKGAEGLMARHGENILLADDPNQFAECVIRLLSDQTLRDRLSANAARLVKDNYDWQVVMPRFLELVERTAAS